MTEFENRGLVQRSQSEEINVCLSIDIGRRGHAEMLAVVKRAVSRDT